MPSGYFAVSNNSQGLETRCYWWSDDNPGANQSTVHVELQARRSSSTTFGNGSWVLHIDGTDYGTSASVSIGSAWVALVGAAKTVSHGANGTRSVVVGVISGGVAGTSWTSTSGTATVGLTDYTRPPAIPAAPTVSAITPTTATVSWITPASPMPVTDYDLHVCESPAHNAPTCTTYYGATGGAGTSKALTGMTPGRTYYACVRARSSEGHSDFSPWTPFTTLAGVYISDGTNWLDAVMEISDGVAWAPATVAISTGSAWVAPK